MHLLSSLSLNSIPRPRTVGGEAWLPPVSSDLHSQAQHTCAQAHMRTYKKYTVHTQVYVCISSFFKRREVAHFREQQAEEMLREPS